MAKLIISTGAYEPVKVLPCPKHLHDLAAHGGVVVLGPNSCQDNASAMATELWRRGEREWSIVAGLSLVPLHPRVNRPELPRVHVWLSDGAGGYFDPTYELTWEELSLDRVRYFLGSGLRHPAAELPQGVLTKMAQRAHADSLLTQATKFAADHGLPYLEGFGGDPPFFEVCFTLKSRDGKLVRKYENCTSSLFEIKSALGRLDGGVCTELFVHGDDYCHQPSVWIWGGNEGRYVVEVQDEEYSRVPTLHPLLKGQARVVRSDGAEEVEASNILTVHEVFSYLERYCLSRGKAHATDPVAQDE
ncbi:hypothetical protein OV207_17740 [Corallococcus sp. BB11-1]|uniref:hypothetical protein n=1 Tax=Corallococcus sp. BB11-1 TaxID=2996783 RepID=UPI00226F7B81|nr:hypothetical protein [Corallococcus sp. BB11-1]MCY1033301.1 hypothetical protein [Corallococcus sp. BB11-1]